jgi:hypothetical protein
MPVYLGQDVTDDYLQALIAAYRAGYGDKADEGDQAIIDSLEAHTVVTARGAQELGAHDAAKDGAA